MIRLYPFVVVAGTIVGCAPPCPCRETAKSVPPPCTSASASSAAPFSATAPSTMPTGASPVGVWESPACDARTYARRLELRADQTFTAEDFVSPCPEGAQCVWSGIETRKGEWQKGAKLILLREDPTGAKLRATFPLELEWDGRLREGACEYKRLNK